jgi:hypothetical protein
MDFLAVAGLPTATVTPPRVTMDQPITQTARIQWD